MGPDHVKPNLELHVPLPNRVHVPALPPHVHPVRVRPLAVLVLGRSLEGGVGVALDRLPEVVRGMLDVLPVLRLRLRLLVRQVVVPRGDAVLVLVTQVPPRFAEEDLDRRHGGVGRRREA